MPYAGISVAMPKMPPPCQDVDEPPPRFASANEIALAEALRRQLEEQYLGRPGTQASLPAQTAAKH
jgi:hypothetical protein